MHDAPSSGQLYCSGFAGAAVAIGDTDDCSSLCSDSSTCTSSFSDSDTSRSAQRRHGNQLHARSDSIASSSILSSASEDTCSLHRATRPAPGGPSAGPHVAPPAVVRSSHSTLTEDGWRLHLLRVVRDPSAAPCALAKARWFPVVLCPGLASGGVESFDLDSRVSMAQHLAERGYDVWVPDLRGNGRSDKPSWWNKKTWWTVDDHMQSDVPAVIKAVQEATGCRQLHWVGHSMGGMLAVGATSRGLDWGSALRSVTLLSSGCFGAGSWHSYVGPLVRRITALGFHAGHLVPFATALKGPFRPIAWGVQALFYTHDNVDREVAEKLMSGFLSFIPSGVVAQFMGSLNGPQGMCSSDGSWRYAEPKALSHCTTPVMAINGDRDLFCPAAGGLKTVNMFGGPHRRFLFLGPSYGTAKHHYGHFCTLVGKHAKAEVFPHIEAFISEFDAQQDGAGGAAATIAQLPVPVKATPAAEQ